MDDTSISRSLDVNELDLSLSQHDVEILWNNDSPSPTVRQAKRLKANLKREQPTLSQIARKFDAVEGKSCVPPLLAVWLESEPPVAASANTFEQERKDSNKKKKNTRHVAKDSCSLIAELQNIVHSLQQPTRNTSRIAGKNDAVSNVHPPDKSGSDELFSSDEDVKQINKNQVNVESKEDMANNSAWDDDDPFNDDSFVRDTIALTQRVEQDTRLFSPPALPLIREICETSTPVSSRFRGRKHLLSRKRDKELMVSPVLRKKLDSGIEKTVKTSGGGLNGISKPVSFGLSIDSTLAVAKTNATKMSTASSSTSTCTSQTFVRPQSCLKPECDNSNAKALVDLLVAPATLMSDDTSIYPCDNNNSITDDLLLALAEPDNSLDNLVPCQLPTVAMPRKESVTKLAKASTNSNTKAKTANVIKPGSTSINHVTTNQIPPLSYSIATSVSSTSSKTVAVSKYQRSGQSYPATSSNFSQADSLRKLACGNTGVTQQGPSLQCQGKSSFANLVTNSNSVGNTTAESTYSESVNNCCTTSENKPLRKAVNSNSITTRQSLADSVANKNKVDMSKQTRNNVRSCSTVNASGSRLSTFPSSKSFYSAASARMMNSCSSNRTLADLAKRPQTQKISSKNNNLVALSMSSVPSARTTILNNASKSASVPTRTDFSKKTELCSSERTGSSMPNIKTKAPSSAEEPSGIDRQNSKVGDSFGDDEDDSLLQSEEFLTMLNAAEMTASQKSKCTAKEIEEKRQQAIARRSQRTRRSLSQEATPSRRTRQLQSKALSSSNL